MMNQQTDRIIGSGVRNYQAPTVSNKELIWPGGAAASLCRRHEETIEYRLISSRHVIMFTKGGIPTGESRFDGKVFKHHGNRPVMSVLPSGCEQTGWSAKGGNTYTALFLDPRLFSGNTVRDSESIELRAGWLDPDPFSWQLADAITAECEAGAPGGLLYTETAATMLSLHLLRRHSTLEPRQVEPSRGGLAPYQLKRVTDYIGDRLTDELSLGELAGLVGLSAHHFCRVFKQSTGLPPHRWQIQQRVEKAKSLMLGTDLSLAEIAGAAGFSDQSHFTTVFRKAVGATPNAWRRATRS